MSQFLKSSLFCAIPISPIRSAVHEKVSEVNARKTGKGEVPSFLVNKRAFESTELDLARAFVSFLGRKER